VAREASDEASFFENSRDPAPPSATCLSQSVGLSNGWAYQRERVRGWGCVKGRGKVREHGGSGRIRAAMGIHSVLKRSTTNRSPAWSAGLPTDALHIHTHSGRLK